VGPTGHGNEVTRPLRVAVVAPPFYEVPPSTYGGTELVCYLLVEALVDRGHDVTLVASGGDHTRARFVRTFPQRQPEGTESEATVEVLHAARAAAYLEAADVDVVHDHTRAGPLTAVGRRTPTIVTVHAPVAGPGSQVEMFRALGRHVSLVAISKTQRQSAPDLNWAGTVYDGIRVDEYPFRADKEEFVLYLGRFSAQKGVHLAVDAARTARRRLVVAGKWTVPSERAYFEEQVRPSLGPETKWVGEVGPAEKKDLLSRASCLLFPAQWDEPFGLVMVEAMACGTPVVALRAGSVPELVVDGETGVVCDRASGLPEAIVAAGRLDPARCRAHVSRHFDVAQMVDGYEAIYRRLLAASERRSPTTAPR
jgi:glycosyltransferase involved in cell wall biosynthesis